MKVFVPFAEQLVDELASVGEALIPFRLDFQRRPVQWEQVEVLDDAEPTKAPVLALTSE